jgi:PAS domain-containing protein
MDADQARKQADGQPEDGLLIEVAGAVDKPKVQTLASTVEAQPEGAARAIPKPKDVEERGAGRLVPMEDGQHASWIRRLHESALGPHWKTVFVHIRWGVFFWVAADLWWHWQMGQMGTAWAVGLLLCYLTSQVGLILLPLSAFEELWPATAIFLFDLTYLMGAMWQTGQADGPLVLACSLAVFAAALTHKVLRSFLGAVMAATVWLGLQMYTIQGFDVIKPEQALVLPLIFLLALLMGATSEMAQDEIIERRSLEASHDILSGRLKKDVQELAVAYQFGTGLLDALPLAVMVMDNQGVIRFFNQESEAILDLKRRKVMDKPMADEPLLVPFREAMAAARRHGVYLEALSFANASGENFCMGFRAVPVMGSLGETLGSIGLLLPGDFKAQGLDATREGEVDHKWDSGPAPAGKA